jgi:sarcosine oxidase subunit gamma
VLDADWPTAVGSEVTGAIEGESSQAASATILCVGPADWLVVAPEMHAASLMRLLQAAFQATSFRATDLSSALVRIQLESPEAATLLSQGCSLDLHPEVFSPGRSARTRFAGMPVLIRCTRPDSFECIVSHSYRDYLLAWFADAASGL